MIAGRRLAESPRGHRGEEGGEHCRVKKGWEGGRMVLGEPDLNPGRSAPAEVGEDETISSGKKS